MKGIFWKEGESFSNSMSLIAFLLVRYPEIGSVRYDPEQKTMQFSFMMVKAIAEPELVSYKEKLTLSLSSMAQLQGRGMGMLQIGYNEDGEMGFLEVIRDVDSLSQEEIALIIGITQQFFEGFLFLDQEETSQEDDVLLQEEMIEHMLEDLKDSRQEKKLIGFREEGRVMIFNRNNLQK